MKILENFDIDILLFGTFISQNWKKNGKCFQTKITLFRLKKKSGTIHHQPLHISERYSQNQKFAFHTRLHTTNIGCECYVSNYLGSSTKID